MSQHTKVHLFSGRTTQDRQAIKQFIAALRQTKYIDTDERTTNR